MQSQVLVFRLSMTITSQRRTQRRSRERRRSRQWRPNLWTPNRSGTPRLQSVESKGTSESLPTPGQRTKRTLTTLPSSNGRRIRKRHQRRWVGLGSLCPTPRKQWYHPFSDGFTKTVKALPISFCFCCLLLRPRFSCNSVVVCLLLLFFFRVQEFHEKAIRMAEYLNVLSMFDSFGF